MWKKENIDQYLASHTMYKGQFKMDIIKNVKLKIIKHLGGNL